MKKIRTFIFGERVKGLASSRPTGISRTLIPRVFIDNNPNPIWDNNHKLLHNSKKIICQNT